MLTLTFKVNQISEIFGLQISEMFVFCFKFMTVEQFEFDLKNNLYIM